MNFKLSTLNSVFSDWLHAAALDAGAADAACLRRDSRLRLDELERHVAEWLDAGNRGRFAYLDESLATRLNPFAARPWAASAIVVAFCGDWGNLAAVPPLPAAAPGAPCGTVSHYACGQDYHRCGQRILATLKQRLAEQLGRSVRTEASVDTGPVADVFMAVEAGLGLLGHSGLLRSPHHGSRVFIGTLFVDTELPEVRRVPPPMIRCDDCGRCIRFCPNAALARGRPLNTALCRSCLSMEYRGPLTLEQQKLLGHTLFGCDACTACCPPAAAAEPVRVDLEWLLRAPAAEVKRRIAGTALAYAGATLLRRNAVAILLQHYRQESAELIDHVLRTSGSEIIRQTIAAGRST